MKNQSAVRLVVPERNVSLEAEFVYVLGQVGKVTRAYVTKAIDILHGRDAVHAEDVCSWAKLWIVKELVISSR